VPFSWYSARSELDTGYLWCVELYLHSPNTSSWRGAFTCVPVFRIRKLIFVKTVVGKPDGKRPLGRFRRRWEDSIGTDLRETGCIWPRIGTSDEQGDEIFGFHKKRGIYWLADRLLASKEGLISMELFFPFVTGFKAFLSALVFRNQHVKQTKP
jgi:hypothetical protein